MAVVSNRTLAELLQVIGAGQAPEVDAWRYITVSSDEKATTAPRDPSHLAEVRGSNRPVGISGSEYLALIGNGASDKLSRRT
jgi:hypothetical protein